MPLLGMDTAYKIDERTPSTYELDKITPYFFSSGSQEKERTISNQESGHNAGLEGSVLNTSLSSYSLSDGLQTSSNFTLLAKETAAENLPVNVDFNLSSSPYAYNSIFNNSLERLLKKRQVFQPNAERGLINGSDELQELRILQKIGDLFVYNVNQYGKTIIAEQSTPDDKKTIQKANIGGIAGGDKYKVGGILFKFAGDKQIGNSWLYGANKRNDFLAAKAAGQELLSANYIGSSDAQLHIPLMALLDYWGQRLVATALLPINNDTLIYGSADAGRTIKTDVHVGGIMDEIAKELHLKKHLVNGVPMALCGDIEVHQCEIDGSKSYYCIDTARVFPPAFPSSISFNRQSIFYEKLRPELTKRCSISLSSDCFSGFQDPTEALVNNQQLTKISEELLGENLNSYIKILIDPVIIDSLLESTSTHNHQNATYGRSSQNKLIRHMHSHGFNVRHLGYLYNALEHVRPEEFEVSPLIMERFKRFVFNTMKTICTLLKNYTRLLLREKALDSYEYKKIVVAMMNDIAQCSQEFQSRISNLLESQFGKIL